MPPDGASDAPGTARKTQQVITPEIASEAAVWVARLHGPDRSAAVNRACLAWQARSAAHRLAFERCTDTWQDVSGLTLSGYAAAVGAAPHDAPFTVPKLPRRAALTSAALASVALAVWRPWARDDVFETGVGEQRAVVLPDGTRVMLNTATLVRATLGRARRTVQVSHGEALFEVAKDASRPFVVQVADADVTATGTTFLVRTTPQGGEEAFGVTLIEGQVVVRRAGSAAHGRQDEQFVMAPGERLRVGFVGVDARDVSGSRLDRPKIENLTAWKRGEVVLDDVPLADAVAEMNRYSNLPVGIVGGESIGALRVSGVMRAGDSEAFARAVAGLHGLSVRMTPGRIELDTQ